MVLGGVLKIILVVALLVIAGSIVTFYIPSVFDGLNNWLASVYNASFFLIQPQQGEAICDLLIQTHVSITQDDFDILGFKIPDTKTLATPLEYTIPVNNPYTYEYVNCVFVNQFVIANLLDNGIGQAPRPVVSSIPTNAFLNPFGHDFTQQIRLTDANDPTQRVDWILSPNLSYTTTIPISFQQETPLSLNAQFIVPNIPVRTYNLEIYLTGADLGINNMPIGEPFKGQICNQFQTFSAGKCT